MKIFKSGELIKASDINANFSKAIKTDLSNCPIIPCNKGGTGRTDCTIAYADNANSANMASRLSNLRNIELIGHVIGNADFDGNSDIQIQCKIPDEIDVLKKIWTEISNIKSSIEENGTGVNFKNFAILWTGTTDMYGYTNVGGFRIVPTGSAAGWKAYLPSGGKWLVIRHFVEDSTDYIFQEYSGGSLILHPFKHNILFVALRLE